LREREREREESERREREKREEGRTHITACYAHDFTIF